MNEPRPLLVCDDLDGCAAAVAATHPNEVDIRSPERVDGLAWCAAPLVLVTACCLPRLGRQPLRPDVYLLATSLGQAHRAAGDAARLAPAGVFTVPDQAPALRAAVRRALTVPRQLIGVIAGTGGAGASTLAVALAFQALRRVRSVALVDADPYGGDLAHLVGDTGRHGDRALLGKLTVLHWDQPAPLLEPAEALRIVTDLLPRYAAGVVDLPRGLDDAARVFATAAAYLVLVVARGDHRALAAAERVVRGLHRAAGPVRLLVATRALRPGRAPLDVAEALGMPLACHIDHDPTLGSGSPGRGGGPLAVAAGQILALLAPDGT